MRIEPTIGRIVWFFPPIDNGRQEDGQPFGAMIAGVNDDASINLLVAARDGSPYGVQNVPLLQDGDDIDQDTAHAIWMCPTRRARPPKPSSSPRRRPLTSGRCSEGSPRSKPAPRANLRTSAPS